MIVINDYVVLKKIKEESHVYIHESDKPEYFIGEVIAFDKKINFLTKGDIVLYDSVYEGFDMEYNDMKCVIIKKKYINGRERD